MNSLVACARVSASGSSSSSLGDGDGDGVRSNRGMYFRSASARDAGNGIGAYWFETNSLVLWEKAGGSVGSSGGAGTSSSWSGRSEVSSEDAKEEEGDGREEEELTGVRAGERSNVECGSC